MNWRFIISWTVKFVLCVIVWDIAVWITNSMGLAFFMALGFLILFAIAESYVIDWWEKRRESKHFVKAVLLTLALQCLPLASSAKYIPENRSFICENGSNRFTRALYGGHTDFRIETSDKAIFAIVKKDHHRSLTFEVEGVRLDSAQYTWCSYEHGTRTYTLWDHRWEKFGDGVIRVKVVALLDEEGAAFEIIGDKWQGPFRIKYHLCNIAGKKMNRNGDLGVDDPGTFDPAPDGEGMEEGLCASFRNFGHLVIHLDKVAPMGDISATELFNNTVARYKKMAERVVFNTPDPYINTLGWALVMAADGDWDGKTWLHGCIGWRTPLPGWRAAYVGDVLGWDDRAVTHFNAYAKSQVTQVPPTIKHPSQDPEMNMARAEKKWGTQMYSNGYICRSPERNDQMHHYDMNLNYIDELLWHFQYNADKTYMRKMWPVIKSHLEWEKRNFDPDGDHLYDAYCCIWASDALYYSGGAVTHSSAYNYRANKMAARIAELIGENPAPYQEEAEAILKAMNERLWIKTSAGPSEGGKNVGGHWAEYQDALGLKRLHESAAVWSIYTPIDCGAGTPEQFYQATQYVDREIPHIEVEGTGLKTVATSNWMPYVWSINNVAPAEVMHTALAYFQAGRTDEGYNLLKANVMDNMYNGQSPANFGQLSQYDAARGECYRDFGDVIGISSRTLIQGLFGIIPNALYGECIIRPGFPSKWDKAQIRTPYLEYKYTRTNGKVRIEVWQNFAKPLKIVVRQNEQQGKYRDVEGSAEQHQVIEYEAPQSLPQPLSAGRGAEASVADNIIAQSNYFTLSQGGTKGGSLKFKKVYFEPSLNAKVTDIFKNKYTSPRPQTTTLQIPVQGVGEWCHPKYLPTIDDSGFRNMVRKGEVNLLGVPFRTPKDGNNIMFVSLWDNYPNEGLIPLEGKASTAYLLMAGTTNPMQSRIDNGVIVVRYADGTSTQLPLRNPDNWCPIEQDYYVDGKAFSATNPRPYRVSLSTGEVSRDLGEKHGLKGADGREIPGGAAQLLSMPLDPKKELSSLTVQALSNDVVIGLMAVTLQ